MTKLARTLLPAALLLLSGTAHAADSADAVWRDVRESDVPRGPQARQIVPERYRALAVNRGRLQALLAQAPREDAVRAPASPVVLELPLADGAYGTFRIVESPVMEPALAAKFPQIRTYLGQGVDDPTATARFDVTPKGFHAQIVGAEGTVYVDPYQPGDVDHYIAYRKRDHTHGTRGVCSVTGQSVTAADAKAARAKLASGATLRTYRLAMAATGEYTAFHGGTVLDGLSAIVTTVNRVNGIYEREVSVRMVLVANNDLIVYTNAATDPYANTSGDLNTNQTNINAVIGTANYDIGHLVGTGGGGVAGLGVVCTSSKARGLTGSSAPVADGFDVDYVAHEIGHQFAGNHTFNGSGVNCAGGNRNASTAYEPGSGITIQAYAGICGADNLQPNSDDFFHRVSLNEILTFTTTGSGSTCGTTSATGNAVPTVSTPATFTIPGRTPFTLTASGSDADGDALTYSWEQFDLGAANAAGVLDATVTTGPIFRPFAPTPSASRTFPSLRYVLNNANAVPATAPLPGTTSPDWMTGEVLPNASRTLNFRVTVRDNRAGGGGTNEASTAIVVANAAGPFAVTAPNTAVTLAAGTPTTVAWNVAGTTALPISTANVRIALSTDGGYTYPFELVASTANDGSEAVTLPAGVATTQARVRVEAVGNVYFDVSDANFTITSTNTPPTIAVTGSVATRQGSPTASGAVATVSDAQDAASALTVAVADAPEGLAVAVQNVGGTVTLSATASCTLVAPTGGSKAYPVLLRVTDSAGAVSTAQVNVTVGANQTPTLGTYATLATTPGETRQVAPSAAPADANGNLGTVSVTPTTLPGGGTVGIAPDGTVTVVTGAATPFGTYAVRPQAADTCGAVETRSLDVVVSSPLVALDVASATITTGNGLLEPNECNSLSIALRNDGNMTATGVSAVLSTTTPNVTITQPSSSYPDIASGQTRANDVAFQLSSASGLACFSNVDLTLTVSYAEAGSPFTDSVAVTVGQPAGTNYVFSASSGATLPNDGVLLAGSQVDDGLTNLVVPAGFNFSIYGTQYTGGTTLRASSNGNLQFRSSQGADDFANAPLPAAGSGTGQAVFPASAPTLFLQWDDWQLDNVAGAGIYTKLEGVAPNRRWFIEWRGHMFQDGATSIVNRAAIVLRENSNTFDYIYLSNGVGAGANGASATIGVQGASTGTTFTQHSFNSAVLTPGSMLTATIPPAVCTAGSGQCSVAPGVTVAQSDGSTDVAEGGATDSYTLVLDAQPSSNVTIAITADAQVARTPATLTFTPLDWFVPQPVTVSAVDDASAEGAHTGTLTHAASGGGYDGVAIADVVANVADNDAATTAVDLAVDSVLVAGPVVAGERLTYEVTVDNLTVPDVDAAQFVFTLSPTLTNVSWVCVADPGASCPASGSGAPNHAIALDGGTGVAYSIGADIPPGTANGTPLTTTATVSVTTPYADTVPGNDSASTSHTVGDDVLFEDGFE